tara:strand:- start:130 stop:942 length:813 start_codon:yes stop_codon:yes gene_type:complete
MNWKRVNRLSRCPVCGKPDWCLVSPDRSAVICPRIEEGSCRYIDGSGYLHVLKWTDDWKDENPVNRVQPLPEHNEVLAIQARRWITECEPERIDELSERLGVEANALRLLNVGYMSKDSSWIFPMLRKGNRLIGVRTRPKNGKKYALRGSKNGLFIPNNLDVTKEVLVCEGESDTSAILSCGLNAVGRPSCNSGGRLLVELLKDSDVIICSDRDGAGRRGSGELCKYLSLYCKSVKIMEPPFRYNDMREWYRGEGKEEIRNTAFRLLGKE